MDVGHCRERGPGKWELRVRRGPGLPIATKTVAAKTKRAAEKLLVDFASEVLGGKVAVAPAKLSVAAWFDQWLDVAAGEVRPVTMLKYRQTVRLYIKPAFAGTTLRDLSPSRIQAVFGQWAVGGRHRGEGGLAKSTLGLHRKIMHAALQRAVELELIPRNPMEPLRRRLPNGRAPEAKVLDAETTADLIATVDHPTYAPAVWLAAGCGLRRGEVVALKWKAIDFASGRITISESTTPLGKGVTTGKTKSGRTRTITAPTFVIEKLKAHRISVAQRLLAQGERLTADHTVLLNPDGDPVNPHCLTAWCKAKFGKLHMLRHSHASQLLNANVNIKAVSARLGHNSAAMTLSVYAHCLPGADEDAAEKIDALLSGSSVVANGS